MAQVQLTTDVKNYEYATLTLTGSAPAVRYPTTTRPASAKGSLVIGGTQNYLKLQMYSENSSAAQNLAIYGWNFCSAKMIWIPQFLYKAAGTPQGSGAVMPFGLGTMRMVGNYLTSAPIQASTPTNSKTLAPIDAEGTAFTGHTLLIDCVGSQFLELCAWGTDNTVNHIFTSSI